MTLTPGREAEIAAIRATDQLQRARMNRIYGDVQHAASYLSHAVEAMRQAMAHEAHGGSAYAVKNGTITTAQQAVHSGQLLIGLLGKAARPPKGDGSGA